MNPFRILITNDLYDTYNEQLKALGESCFEWIRIDFDKRPGNFLELLATADCLVSREDLTDEEYRIAKGLKLFQLPIAGYNQIDLHRAERYHIPVCNNAGANAISVAEHFFLMVLTLYRHMFHHHQTVMSGSWVNLKHYNREMCGKTVAIIGLGNVGRQVAIRCKAFGMKVLYNDIRHDWPDFEVPEGAIYRNFPSLVTEADIVTFHVPLTHRTRNMINRDLLSRMRPDAVLVNLARGEIQDEEAIWEALRDGRLAGVALDVFRQEPPPTDLPLLAFGKAQQETWPVLGKPGEVAVVRAVFSPHAGPSAETRLRVVEHVVNNIRRVYSGQQPLAKVVDYESL